VSDVPVPSELPDKLYFKIGEVAKLIGVKPYVLRYWETEFSILRPGKTRSRHRLYRRKDVENLLEIRRLLYNERYTIEGAKRRLRETGRLGAEGAAEAGATTTLAGLHGELLELYRMLESEPAPGAPPPLSIGKPPRRSPS
jgi:DNA-binding transcriptional MerR regulator